MHHYHDFLLQAKQHQQQNSLAQLAHKEDLFQSPPIPVLLASQYASALTDHSVVFSSELNEGKTKFPNPLLFAFLKKELNLGKLQSAIKLLVEHSERKKGDNSHIIIYNISKLHHIQANSIKQIFYLENLLKQEPFFPAAIYDLAIQLASTQRLPQALSLLQRHLSNLHSENPLIHSAFFFCLHQSTSFSLEMLKSLHSKNLTLRNAYNLALLLKKKGEKQKAAALFSEIVQKLKTSKLNNPDQFKTRDLKILILAQINLIKLKKGCNASQTPQKLSQQLLQTQRSFLDNETVSYLKSFSLPFAQQCLNIPHPKQSEQSEWMEEKNGNSFDNLFSRTRFDNTQKLKSLLNKEKTIDLFFKNLKLKYKSSGHILSALTSSINSAKQQLLSGPLSLQTSNPNSQEPKIKVHLSNSPNSDIQTLLQNLLVRLDLEKKEDKVVNISPSPPQSEKPNVFCSSSCSSTKKKDKKSSKEKSQNCKIDNLHSFREEKTFHHKKTNHLASERSFSKFRIKPLCKVSQVTIPKVNEKMKISSPHSSQQQYFPDRQIDSNDLLEEKVKIKDQNIVQQTKQVKLILQIQQIQPQTSNMSLEKEQQQVSKPTFGQLQQNEKESAKPDEKEMKMEIKPREESCFQQKGEAQQKQEELRKNIQSGLEYTEEIKQKQPEISQKQQHIESHQQESQISAEQQFNNDEKMSNKNSQKSFKTVVQKIVEQDLEEENNKIPLIFMEKNNNSFKLLQEVEQKNERSNQGSKLSSEQEVKLLEDLPSQQKLNQPKQTKKEMNDLNNFKSENVPQKSAYFDPLASTFNLTGFSQTQLLPNGSQPCLSPFSFFEAFSAKPQPETTSEAFQVQLKQVEHQLEEGQLEKAYMALLEMYKQFKREGEKLIILLKIGEVFECEDKYVEAQKTFVKSTKFNSAEAFFKLGSLQLKMGKIEEGVENLEKANCLKRFDIKIENKLVYGYSMKEETMDKALTLAHTILRKDPNSLETLFITAGILQKQGLLEEAIQIVTAIDESRQAEYIKHYLGVLYMQNSNLKQAFLCFKAALALQPNYVPSLIEVASIISESHPKDAIVILNKALKLNPGNRKALARLGKIYESEGDFQNAMNTYKIALQSQENYESYMKIGDCLAKKESYIEALLNYKEALSLNKTHQAHAKVALMFELKNEWSKAIEHYQAALTLLPNTPQENQTRYNHFLSIGRLQLRLGQYEAATEVLEETLETSESPEVLKLLGEASFGSRQYSTALQFFQKANELGGGGNLENLQSMAICLDRMEEYLASKALYQKILEKNPSNVRCLNNLANILLITGETNEAFFLFETMLEKAPRNLQKRLKVADIYAQVGDWSKVEFHLLQCYRQRQHDARILEKLVVLYKQKRDNKMAAKYQKKLALIRTSHKNKGN